MEKIELLKKIIDDQAILINKLQVEKLIDTIEDYRNQITYLGKSLERKDEQMTVLIHSIKDSLETIKEAKEKGLDKE